MAGVKGKGRLSPEIELLYTKAAARYVSDPLGFVRFGFPWGKTGTSLVDFDGPDTWQIGILEDIKKERMTSTEAVQIAVASGHGIGKTALVAWIILWFISTRPHPQIVVTANTKAQLDNKTWRELAKWHKLLKIGELFEWTATKFYRKSDPETWFAAAIPWSANNSEAFAGTHEKHVLIMYDEASGIDDAIWEVTEGAMTTPGSMWVAFGNPTKNTGRFRECFGKLKHRWRTQQIDSRTAKMADRIVLDRWVDDYGEDSDFVRVRVRGVFPRASSNQFIDGDTVHAARHRTAGGYEDMPRLMGVDVAREGDDQSVITRRQGPKVWKQKRFRIPDLMQLVSQIIHEINDFKPDVIFIDAIGLGAGVYDRLKQLGYNAVPVSVGKSPTGFHAQSKHKLRYYNLRAEIWGAMKEWLTDGGAELPDDQELGDDLTGIEYGFDNSDRLRLEKKSDMKKRGLASPDSADSLALTFGFPVSSKPKARSSSPRRHADWRAI